MSSGRGDILTDPQQATLGPEGLTREIAIFANNPFEILPTPRLSLTCLGFRHSMLAHDRPDHLALPGRREDRRWRNGGGVQGRGHRAWPLCRAEILAG